ncbi:hypothetical protein GF325_11145 [Candidatus Bathyarchaeota archaeon]|nr:hypothetical protein [Candidatus Bathyarchaeota archaeon]
MMEPCLDVPGMYLLLGETGITILEGLLLDAGDIIDLQVITQLPSSCLDGRVQNLVDLGFIELDDSGDFIITSNGLDFLHAYWNRPDLC